MDYCCSSSTQIDPTLRPTTRQSNSYIVDKGLVFEHYREAILSPSGRFVFSSVDYSHYNFLDLVHGKVAELRLRETDIFSMKRLRLFPLNDFSVLLIAWPSNDSPLLRSYHTAVLDLKRQPLEFSQKSLQQLEWKPLIRVPIKTKVTFFMVDTRLYMLCSDPMRHSTLHYFDLMKLGKFVKSFALFSTKADGNNVDLAKLKDYTEFPLYHDGHLYAFRRLSRLSNMTRSLRHVYDYYSMLYQQNTVTGQVELVKVNDLRFLQIPESTFTESSTFIAEGQWCNQMFYLHIRIRKPKSVNDTIHYFARFDLKTLTWSPFKVQLLDQRLQCPLKMFITHEDVLILMQFHNTQKKDKIVKRKRPHRCKEHGQIYKANFYRIPLRQPETLNTLAQLAYNRYFSQQTDQDKFWMKQKFANVMVKPFYYL